MRRIARAVGAVSGLTLVSLLSAAPAAAEEKSTKPRIAVIEFKNMPGQSAPAPLDVIGFAWGDANAAGPMKPVFVKSWSTSGDADAPPHRGGGSNQMSMDDTAGKEKKPASTGVQHDLRTNVVARTATGGDPDRPVIAGSVPNPTASGQATGKRQHMPVLSGAEGPLQTSPISDQPRGKGSVWIRVGTPWSACRVGARYPSLSLAGGAKAYLLEDVTVASCGGDADDRPTEEVAFYYNKVKVRAWDPKKKEE